MLSFVQLYHLNTQEESKFCKYLKQPTVNFRIPSVGVLYKSNLGILYKSIHIFPFYVMKVLFVIDVSVQISKASHVSHIGYALITH